MRVCVVIVILVVNLYVMCVGIDFRSIKWSVCGSCVPTYLHPNPPTVTPARPQPKPPTYVPACHMSAQSHVAWSKVYVVGGTATCRFEWVEVVGVCVS